jgi:hypothetical protein
MSLWEGGMSGEKLFTAQMLIYCGLPVQKTDEERVVRRARLGGGSWLRITYSKTHPLVPIPFGADRTMVYFLTHKAVVQQSPYLSWDRANEYMGLFNLNPGSGKNYKLSQERFTRVAYMDIMVEHLDGKDNVVEHWKSPLIDHARISAEVDAEGNWRPSTSIKKMLMAEQGVSVGLRFYTELQKSPVPIPLELIHATLQHPRIMDYAVFIYWRAFAAKTESFIPWSSLQDQFDDSDSNNRRWTQKFRMALMTLKSLPDPICRISADVTPQGIVIRPLPVGTEIFPGQPKLGRGKSSPEA